MENKQYIIAQEEHDYNKKYEEGTIVKHTIDDNVTTYVAKKNVPQFTSILNENYWKKIASTDEGGTVDYDNLKNKPTINGVELDGNKTSSDLGVATSQQGAKADTAYQKPSSGIPQSDLSSDVQSQLNKHFKGWFNTLAELKAAYTATEGDSAYVKDASPATTWSIYVYDSTAGSNNFWSDSGTDADTSHVQTFASGEEVNDVHIIDDLTTGGTDDVLSAEQGKVLGEAVKDTIKGESYNLFNKDAYGFINGKYVSSNGVLSDNANSIVSPLIPIKPNTVYAFSKIGDGNKQDCYFRFVAQDGISFLKPLNPDTSEEIAYSLTVPSKLLKSPATAAYAQFTVKFSTQTSIAESAQLIETDTLPTIYYPYNIVLPYEKLPLQLLTEVSNKVEKQTFEKFENNAVNKNFSVNLFNRDDDRIQLNKFINIGEGNTIISLNNFCITHPIFVEAGTIIKTLYNGQYGSSNRLMYIDNYEKVDAVLEIVDDIRIGFLYTIPRSGYVLINCYMADIPRFMVCVKNEYPSEYVSYKCIIDDKGNLDLSESLIKRQNIAQYVKVTEKNLINPEEVQLNRYIAYAESTGLNKNAPAIQDGAACSGLIPVTPGKVYYLTRAFTSDSAIFCFIKSDGYSTTYALDPQTNEHTPLECVSRAYKAPQDAAYALICLALSGWTDTETQIVGFQFEEGDIPTQYEPYYEKDVITEEHLPNSVSDVVENINIANSEKIGFFSNSFLNGYCMLNHHAINNMSMFSDYIMYNYGHSGDDILELLKRIDSNENHLGAVPVRNWNIKYGIIAMQDNDGALYAANADTYYQNSKKMCEAIKFMGGIPILSTEHDWNNYYYAFNRLNNEEGYMYMKWGMKADVFSKDKFAQMWYNGHPATRTSWLWSYGMQPYIDTLPRPNKSIKLFRVRNASNLSDLQSLVYNTYLERAERFIELTCGVSALTAATEKYFDRLNLGYTVQENVQDEYQKIQAGTSVSFGNAALIEVITPYDRNNLKSFNVTITSTGTISHAYCKKVNGLINPLPSKRYYSFGITSGENLLNVGDSITISGIERADGVDLNRTFTIGGIINGMLITTTTSSPSQSWTNGKTSGTDEPTCDISGVVLHGSYDYPDADYMERYNKPLGEWTEVVINNGTVELTKSQLNDFTDFDKIAILLTGSNISISYIQAAVIGSVVKTETKKRLIESENGTSILTNTTFTSSDTAWIGIGNLTDYTPITDVNNANPEVLPMGFTNVKIMNEGESVYQAITTTGLWTTNQLKPKKLQLKVIARYFPKYIKNDTDWETTELDRNTLDIAKLKVYFAQAETSTNPTPIAEIPVGAWWNEFVVDVDFAGQGNYLKLECTSKSIQIGKCDLVKLDN